MRARTSASDIESEVTFPRDAPRVRFNGCAKELLGQGVDGISPCYAVCSSKPNSVLWKNTY